MISLQTLYRFPLFAGLDEETLKAIAIPSEMVEASQGEWLFHEGDPADSLYIILEGSIDLKMALNADPHYGDLERLNFGEVVGWSALVEPFVYTLGAVAVDEGTRLARLDAGHLRALMERDTEVGYRLMRRMAGIIRRRLAAMHTRFVSLMVA
jgi:CRP/FNR family cyclic AMP-dependent transcriptional regulator